MMSLTLPSARVSHWKERLLVSLLLALFVLALFARLLFTNRVLATGDILLYFYPYRDYAAAALRAGRIPLWNPYLFTGVPFLANTQAAVLYPLHWPLAWLPVTSQIYWSAAIHAWLLGFGGYLLLRRLGGGMAGGVVTGLVLAGSGFYGGMIGHINQMNGAAWLPWAVLAVTGGRTRRILLDGAALALLTALMLLAGHTQTTYINLFGVGLWSAGLALHPVWSGRSGFGPVWRRLEWSRLDWRPPAVYALGVGLGALLSAPQLLPTLELSGLGIRSGGLAYRDATSFSLPPLDLLWTLLPTYGLADLEGLFGTPAYSEFVAYVGLVGLLLALLGAAQRRHEGITLARAGGLFLVAVGFLLALGRWNPLYALLHAVVPGFDLFRTPARWMMLYTLGAALLAGVGAQRVLAQRRAPLLASVLLGVLVAADLLLAAQALPHAHPTAPDAVYSIRTAPAHLLSNPARTALDPAASGRFLGMSTITYDPGDMADYRRLLLESEPPQLSPRTFQDFVVALKVQELLVPNLPLLRQIPSVDGYDGGVLPLERYNALASLLMPPGALVPDGRLREQIQSVPNAQLLALFNVQYVVTDKVRDLWFDDVFYDRRIGARLTGSAPLMRIESPTPFAPTHIDLIAFAEGALPADGVLPIATLTAGEQVFTLTAGNGAGAHLADPALDSLLAARSGAVVALRDVDEGRQEYRIRLALDTPALLPGFDVRLTDPAFTLTVQAATLFDARTGMFQALLPSDRGRFRLVHSGDVKIYENLDVQPRAWLAHRTISVELMDDALTALALEALPPSTAVVEGDLVLEESATPGDSIEIVHYAPEQVEIRTRSAAPALLVLGDAYYPGWQATLDGEPVDILPANILFRGVALPAGEHTVLFRFAPNSWRTGVRLGILGGLLWLVVAVTGLYTVRRMSTAVV